MICHKLTIVFNVFGSINVCNSKILFNILIASSLSSSNDVSNFISILFSITDTLSLEKTSDLEQGTTSRCPFNHTKTRLTLLYSEYRAILEEISNSTRSPLAYWSWNLNISSRKTTQNVTNKQRKTYSLLFHLIMPRIYWFWNCLEPLV